MFIRNDKTYLLHVRDAIEKIEEYLGDSAYDEFASNEMVIEAVVRKLEIIGEAASKLSE